jgi:Na+/phosphate symporter
VLVVCLIGLVALGHDTPRPVVPRSFPDFVVRMTAATPVTLGIPAIPGGMLAGLAFGSWIEGRESPSALWLWLGFTAGIGVCYLLPRVATPAVLALGQHVSALTAVWVVHGSYAVVSTALVIPLTFGPAMRRPW